MPTFASSVLKQCRCRCVTYDLTSEEKDKLYFPRASQETCVHLTFLHHVLTSRPFFLVHKLVKF